MSEYGRSANESPLSSSSSSSLALMESEEERKTKQLLEKENSESVASARNPIIERVNLSSTAFADPILPLELHYLIAQFLLGTDKYRSLANYSLVCRVVRQELRPVLFETVVHERADVLSTVGREEGGMRGLFKDTKYLIVSDTCQWTPSDLPNLVVAITMHRPTVSPSGNRRRPRHSTRASSIRILKPVNIKTLELLLRIPLLWESVNGHGGSNSMPRYQFIDHIKSIDVDALQSVHGDNMMCEQTTSSSKLGNIDTTFNLSHPNPTSELRETIKHLLGLVVTAAASSQSRVDCEEESKTPRLHFRVKEGGGPVAQLVNEICNQPLPGGFWPFVTMDI